MNETSTLLFGAHGGLRERRFGSSRGYDSSRKFGDDQFELPNIGFNHPFLGITD